RRQGCRQPRWRSTGSKAPPGTRLHRHKRQPTLPSGRPPESRGKGRVAPGPDWSAAVVVSAACREVTEGWSLSRHKVCSWSEHGGCRDSRPARLLLTVASHLGRLPSDLAETRL